MTGFPLILRRRLAEMSKWKENFCYFLYKTTLASFALFCYAKRELWGNNLRLIGERELPLENYLRPGTYLRECRNVHDHGLFFEEFLDALASLDFKL